MDWFYAINGQRNGPVSDLQLDGLLGSGEINQDTLLWREGMPDWLPMKTVRPGGPPPIPAAQTGICAECGRAFSQGDLIQLNRVWVCAECKPSFLQKVLEGVASPKAPGSMWRMNKQLVTVSETPFPDRCVKCNAPVHGFRLKRVLYWQHPAYYLFLLCNLLVLVVVLLIVRKKAVLHIGLCEIHRAQRKRIILIGWLGVLGGLALIGFGLVSGVSSRNGAMPDSSIWMIVMGALLFLGTLLYAGLRAPMISAAKITDGNVWVKGVHRDFLAELPEWLGP